MRKIGDDCRGRIENEEEIELRNHLIWARIKVRGPKEKILTSIEIVDSGLIYSMLVWCESLVTYNLAEKKWAFPQGSTARKIMLL